MRDKVALFLAIISFACIFCLIDMASFALGLPLYIDYGGLITVSRGGGRTSYEEEVSGEVTDLGFFQFIAASMIAWRIYHLILNGSFVDGLDVKSRRSWWAFFLSALAYISVMIPVSMLDIPPFFSRCVSFSMLLGLFFLFRSHHGESLMRRLVKA